MEEILWLLAASLLIPAAAALFWGFYFLSRWWQDKISLPEERAASAERAVMGLVREWNGAKH